MSKGQERQSFPSSTPSPPFISNPSPSHSFFSCPSPSSFSLGWICPDYFWESLSSLWDDKIKEFGPVLSGALFGFGWWFWIDAVVVNNVNAFIQFLPGILATISIIIMNIFNSEDISNYDPFDDDSDRRTRFWLFISYVLSIVSILFAGFILIKEYALNDDKETWPGVAEMFHVVLILASGLVFFSSRRPSETPFL